MTREGVEYKRGYEAFQAGLVFDWRWSSAWKDGWRSAKAATAISLPTPTPVPVLADFPDYMDGAQAWRMGFDLDPKRSEEWQLGWKWADKQLAKVF